MFILALSIVIVLVFLLLFIPKHPYWTWKQFTFFQVPLLICIILLLMDSHKITSQPHYTILALLLMLLYLNVVSNVLSKQLKGTQ